ncbi:MAG: hypothetical protein H7Y33_18635 [Cytophagales bacterium]|nr:hypothetical protein [Rhizobacter sp.]
MSTTISLQVPHSRTAPRFAAPLGELFAAVIAMLVHPGTPAPRYPTREAARVRAMAHRYEAADPRFASELYAAADRHELLYGN